MRRELKPSELLIALRTNDQLLLSELEKYCVTVFDDIAGQLPKNFGGDELFEPLVNRLKIDFADTLFLPSDLQIYQQLLQEMANALPQYDPSPRDYKIIAVTRALSMVALPELQNEQNKAAHITEANIEYLCQIKINKYKERCDKYLEHLGIGSSNEDINDFELVAFSEKPPAIEPNLRDYVVIDRDRKRKTVGDLLAILRNEKLSASDRYQKFNTELYQYQTREILMTYVGSRGNKFFKTTGHVMTFGLVAKMGKGTHKFWIPHGELFFQDLARVPTPDLNQKPDSDQAPKALTVRNQ